MGRGSVGCVARVGARRVRARCVAAPRGPDVQSCSDCLAGAAGAAGRRRAGSAAEAARLAREAEAEPR